MHKLIPPFTRADADRVLDATLAEAARAEARGDVDAAFNLRADAEELRGEFAQHFGERKPGRFHCMRCGAARCACVDLGD